MVFGGFRSSQCPWQKVLHLVQVDALTMNEWIPLVLMAYTFFGWDFVLVIFVRKCKLLEPTLELDITT